MYYLILVSFIWAFSFGLIKGNLTGLDASLVACLRMFLSLIAFLPFLRPGKISFRITFKLIMIGAVQFGIMYIAYIYSYQFLKAYQVALFTIFTPLYISWINDILKRRFHVLFFLTAALAVLGTMVIFRTGIIQQDIGTGFVLLQLANLAFAFGQVFYKRTMANNPGLKDINIFGFLYFGAFLITFLATIFNTNLPAVVLHGHQILTLLYLGLVASGLCFFLWNYGARKVNIGALAVFNNLKIPLAVVVSLMFFKEQGNIVNLLVGGLIIIAALILNETFLLKKKK